MSDLDILRRSAERGLKLAQEKGPDFIDIFQHLLDEIQRANTVIVMHDRLYQVTIQQRDQAWQELDHAALLRKELEGRIGKLMDPIIRMKMMEPSPPIYILNTPEL